MFLNTKSRAALCRISFASSVVALSEDTVQGSGMSRVLELLRGCRPQSHDRPCGRRVKEYRAVLMYYSLVGWLKSTALVQLSSVRYVHAERMPDDVCVGLQVQLLCSDLRMGASGQRQAV